MNKTPQDQLHTVLIENQQLKTKLTDALILVDQAIALIEEDVLAARAHGLRAGALLIELRKARST